MCIGDKLNKCQHKSIQRKKSKVEKRVYNLLLLSFNNVYLLALKKETMGS